MTPNAPGPTHQTRMILVGVIAPLLIGLAGLVAMVVALPDLPDPIAVHWGPSGDPDGFGTPAVGLIVLAVVVIGYAAFAFFVARSTPPSGSTVNQRLILAIGPFFATMLSITLAGAVLMQRGLQDAADAPSIVPLLLLGLGLGLLAGVLAWFLLPESVPAEIPETEDLPMLELGATERATWIQHVGPSRTVGILLVGIGLLLVVGVGMAVWAGAALGVFVAYLAVMLVVAGLVICTLYWKITIDAGGLQVRSAVGFPRFAVPLAEVASATSIEVNPSRDFGGWGLRWGGPKRFGVIARAGEALEVRRVDGRSFVVSVARAKQGAALLNSLARRQ